MIVKYNRIQYIISACRFTKVLLELLASESSCFQGGGGGALGSSCYFQRQLTPMVNYQSTLYDRYFLEFVVVDTNAHERFISILKYKYYKALESSTKKAITFAIFSKFKKGGDFRGSSYFRWGGGRILRLYGIH